MSPTYSRSLPGRHGDGAKAKLGLLQIQCSRCSLRVSEPAAVIGARDFFAADLERAGWRALAGRALQVVCPACAKKCKPEGARDAEARPGGAVTVAHPKATSPLCPATNEDGKICRIPIKRGQLLCARHWFQVPKVLRDRIWQLARTRKGSDEHRAACFEAILGFKRAGA